eukprot:gnl/TRDRNA2_/TRDRNA2_47291_c0_seq1.p1 gnl/TRDRNA2_/TRDRNA2_47291_c0~~gnl/TRDRNA2_/TRDRNA2_47291_c0_seq1.p1  ORF type:complete len:537 (+),score=182.11 gnl/TRDRNA2_/TRDRNA2_47291_c0_seq1:134-1744(+)
MANGRDGAFSLANFGENDPKAAIKSPRSLLACKQEGVLPMELIFKPMEAFAEPRLSPRLVKLRYDFFEAKRRDLLAAAKRARDTIIADERREKENGGQQLEAIAKQHKVSKGAILALGSDGLKLERQKLLRAQEHERMWLQTALNNELANCKAIEHHNQKMTQEAADDSEKDRQRAAKMKEINDRRAQEEERKQMENEARSKLEKQIAKEEFAKQQEEVEKQKKKELEKQKAAYDRACAEAEKKLAAERAKQEKKEAEYRAQQERVEEMRAADLKRMDILEKQKQSYQEAMREKKEAKDLKIYQSMEANLELEAKKRRDFDDRCAQAAEREERLSQARALQQEESAKRSFQLLMKRKNIHADAMQKAEDRRNAILEQQEETECRLLEHEMKKERYLDFKRELDDLRCKNKEINVERQRRREEHQREVVAEQVRKKDEKMEMMKNERNRLWQLRRAAQNQAFTAREQVKFQVNQQKIRSKYDSTAVEHTIGKHMKHDLFTDKILTTSASQPTLRKSPGGTKTSMSAGDESVDYTTLS